MTIQQGAMGQERDCPVLLPGNITKRFLLRIRLAALTGISSKGLFLDPGIYNSSGSYEQREAARRQSAHGRVGS